MWTGFVSSPPGAEWLLFVDADTRHHPHMLSSVLLRAMSSGADLLSLVIDVRMESFWERVIVPQIGELYTLLVGTMDQVNREGGSAAANGQFMLVRRDAYAAVGNLAIVRADVAEDRALAAALKARGAHVRLEYGRKLVRARVYSDLREMWAGSSKTLFWASGHNLPKALLVALALTLYAILPPAAALNALLRPRHPQRMAALAHAPLQLVPIFALRAALCRSMNIPCAYALTYPLAVTVANSILLYSTYRVLSGKGVRWKGRTYR
jgi:chlorobactene glucosyltransferase